MYYETHGYIVSEKSALYNEVNDYYSEFFQVKYEANTG